MPANAGLDYPQQPTRLQTLDLDHSQVTDLGLVHLVGLMEL